MAEVRAFPGSTIPGAADGDLVETLEALLEEARSGELRAVAYATVRLDGSLGTGWCGADGTRNAVGMALSMLAIRYPLQVLESER